MFSICECFPTDVPLTSEDLAWILTLLNRIASKWDILLIELGGTSKVVASMKEKSTDPIVLMREGMKNWLKMTSRMPTLGILTRALSSKTVGASFIASQIEKGV